MDTLKSIAMVLLSSVIGLIFWRLGISEANIIMVYILGVLFTAVITTRQIYSLISSVISVVLFNFLFTEPRFSLSAYDKDYPITFVMMFLAAFLTGSMAVRYKKQAEQSRQAEYQTKILFDTNHLLEQVRERDPIITATATQLMKLLNRDLAICLEEPEGKSKPKFFFTDGRKTGAFDWETCLYLPIRTSEAVYGQVGIATGAHPLDSFEHHIVVSILGECGLALENEKNIREKAEAALIAQKEQLRANLLRSISHDLRTPLTSISGNASNLLSNGQGFDEETKKQLYSDIYDDSMWLIDLVENLLSVTRLEEGNLNIHLSTELLDEVVAEALLHISREKTEHHISVRVLDEFILVKVDAKLIMQVVINIVNNAIKYTPKGSKIEITVKRQQDKAVVCIADNGNGIPDEEKAHVFDMFYSGAKSIADSRRSLGLGLSLCRSIISAHGGKLELSDQVPHGAVFTFTLPLEEVDIHE
ncbi:MAG: DUF4118 domain-containing protein [Clostridiales bacterium]|nr:DUF4118 domain-containing protein [Clostridiales bacterium]